MSMATEILQKALSLRERGPQEEAARLYLQAADILEKQGKMSEAAQAWTEAGLLLSESGKDDQALKLHLKAIQAYDELNDQEARADSRVNACAAMNNLN